MAKKKKKKEDPLKKLLGPEPAAPQPRSLGDELGELIPRLGELGGMGSAQYIASQKELTQYQYDFFRQHYPELAAMEREQQRESTRLTREDALSWAWQRGPNAMAVARTTNPAFAQAYDTLRGQLSRVGQRSDISRTLDKQALGMLGTGGPTTPFTRTLDEQALAELQLGGALTAEEERAAQQSARGAYAARGQAMSNPAALAEVLERDSMARARLRERQAIATGRENAAIGRLQYGQAFAGGREAAEQQMLGAERQFVGGALQLSEAVDPTWKYLGMSSGATQPGALLGFTQGVRTPDPSEIYKGGLSYGADLFNTNLNMASSIYNSYQNNRAALYGAQLQSQAQLAAAGAQAGAYGSGGGFNVGGLLGGLGTGVSAGLGLAAAGAGATAAVGGGAAAAASAAIGAAFCWVAREVFGAGSREQGAGRPAKWRIFRVWLALEAPKSLRDFYREHGEAIARGLRNLPQCKAAMRRIMEPIVAT